MSAASEPTLLFVYGTLKRGMCNHDVLADAQFVRECRTAPHFRLFDLGAYPALSLGGARPIVGELYLVSAVLLSRLDVFEGDQYRRSTVSLFDGTPVEAYLLADSARSSAHELDADCWPPT